jgi:Aspartyl protease
MIAVCSAVGSNKANAIPPDPSLQSRTRHLLPVTVFTQAIYDADSSAVVIPFSRSGNLILIKGKADTTEGSFILDTGCPGLVLNLTYFRHYPVNTEPNAEQRGITGSVEGALQTRIADFSFGQKHHYQIDADLVNLGHIENSKGVKVLGLIGMQLLDRYEMIVDFEKNLIYLHSISKAEAKTYQHEMLKDETSYRTVPVELISNRLVVKAVVAGKKIRLIIDSGAEINILDSRLPDNVFELVNITGRTLLNGVGAQKVEALQGNLSVMQIDGQNVENMPVLITNLERSCFANGGCADGVIGFDLLTSKKIGFNFVKRKMYIWK